MHFGFGPRLAGISALPDCFSIFSSHSRDSQGAANALSLAQRSIGGCFIEAFAQKGSKIPGAFQRRTDRYHMIVLSGKKRPSARPGPVLRPVHQPRSHWIERDITQCSNQVPFVHCDRPESALPQMAGHPHPGVDEAGVLPVDIAERPAQRIFIVRQGDDMYVVGHQAVRSHLRPMPRRRLRKQIEVQRIVALLEKCPFTPVATLGDMMGNAGQDHARKARHTSLPIDDVTACQFRGLRTCHRNSTACRCAVNLVHCHRNSATLLMWMVLL